MRRTKNIAQDEYFLSTYKVCVFPIQVICFKSPVCHLVVNGVFTICGIFCLYFLHLYVKSL